MSDNKQDPKKNEVLSPEQDEAPVPAGKVRVMVLAHVGPHKPGQVADVSAEEAKHMCEVRNRHDGHGLVSYQVAMKIEDWKELKAKPVDKGGMTQGELNELGLKFTVETPKDPAFEAHLARVAKANKGREENKVKNQSAALKKANQKKAALSDKPSEANASA